MVSLARFLLSDVGAALWAFCVGGMKPPWALSMYSTTGSYLCSLGTRLCLHLSHQEAERGLMNRGEENEKTPKAHISSSG